MSFQTQEYKIKDSQLAKAYKYFDGREMDSLANYINTFSSEDPLYHLMKGRAYSFKDLDKEALDVLSRIPQSFELYDLVLFNQGNILYSQKKYSKAIEKYTLVEDSPLIQGRTRLEFYQNIGGAYIHLKDYDKAEYYLKLALQNADTDIIKTYAYLDLANVYYYQYQDSVAIDYFKKGYELSKTTDDFLAKKNAAFNMAIVERNREDYKAGFEYLLEHNKWKDSIWNRDKIYDLLDQEKEFEVAKRNEIIALERKFKVLYGIIALFSLALLLGFVFQYFKVRRLNQNLHMIYSILSHDLRTQAASLLLPENQLKKAQVLNQSLNNLLYWTMDQSKQIAFRPGRHEIEIVVNQVAYNFKDRFADRGLDYKKEVLSQGKAYFDLDSTRVILRNLFDNALKYTSENGEICVEIDGSVLSFYNTGLHLSEDQIKFLTRKGGSNLVQRDRGIGLGLTICKRLAAQNGIKLEVIDYGEDQKIVMNFKKEK
ncbi:MAG: tetratricopeptide repeat-containing sensor histidine kinase [Flavobacteriaceae bacterium]